ncbi:hypothetical protein RZS08_32755, partial [Arthrospira platensis SPKY1]|nr:hypothetical protein [Arthrospira platensis SPKY1]
LVPLLEVDPRPRPARRRLADRRQPSVERGRQGFGLRGGAHQRAQGADHPQDPGHVPLVEGVDFEPCPEQGGDDLGLEVGEGQHQIRLQGQDFRHIGRGEGRDPRLLAPDLGRAHRIAGDADDPARLA